MIRFRHSAGWCVILVLISTLIPRLARADDGSPEAPIRLYANESFGPIGKVEGNSLGGNSLVINGRMAHDEPAIWNGDLIEAPADTNASIAIEAVGQVALKKGARARIATALTRLDDITCRVLIVSLTSGNLGVNLQQQATAYVEVRGSVFVTTAGASFRIGIREGRPAIETATGAVWAEALISQPGQPIISRVEFNRNLGSYVDLGNTPIRQNRNQPSRFTAQLKRRKGTRTTRQVSFTPGVDLTESQLAQDEEPVADTSVLFELTPAGLASIDPQKVRTDPQGLATTTVTAGPKAGRGKLKVTAEETGVSREWDVIVLPGIWTTRNKVLIVAAAAGAIVTCIGVCGNHSKPLMQLPPPIIQ